MIDQGRTPNEMNKDKLDLLDIMDSGTCQLPKKEHDEDATTTIDPDQDQQEANHLHPVQKPYQSLWEQEENSGTSSGGIRKDLKSFIDDQLQCTICNDIYICPSVTNCGHTFCEECIERWLKVKRPATLKPTCPICRTEVVSTSPNQALNVLVEEFVHQFFPEEARKSRANVIEQRIKKKNQPKELLPPGILGPEPGNRHVVVDAILSLILSVILSFWSFFLFFNYIFRRLRV